MFNLLLIGTVTLLFAAILAFGEINGYKNDREWFKKKIDRYKSDLKYEQACQKVLHETISKLRTEADDLESANNLLLEGCKISSQVADALLDELDDAQADYIKLDREYRTTQSMLEATNKENGRLDAEILALRDEVSLSQERDKALLATIQDKVHLETALNAIADNEDKNFKRFAKKIAITALQDLYYPLEELEEV